MITNLINKFKNLIKSFLKYITDIISFQGQKQSVLIISFICMFYHIWTLKQVIEHKIEINTIYQLIFYSENLLLIIVCLLMNNLYKIYTENKEQVNKAITKITEKKLNIDINNDGEI